MAKSIAIDQARAKSRRALTWLWFSVLAVAGLLSMMPAHAAQVVGTIVNISGPMVARRADGSIRALSAQSAIEQGDLLVTEKDTYARIKFIDNGEITLRPNTQFKIENFSYEAAKPESDSAFFSLLKGGLRSITGLLGKRNKEKFGLNTPTATIGIRGTTFIAELQDGEGGEGGGNGGTNVGLYVLVQDGMINVKNGGGSQNYTAGQYGFTGGFQQPPIILPGDPGIKFNPPGSFSSTDQGNNGAKPSEIDCIVR